MKIAGSVQYGDIPRNFGFDEFYDQFFTWVEINRYSFTGEVLDKGNYIDINGNISLSHKSENKEIYDNFIEWIEGVKCHFTGWTE